MLSGLRRHQLCADRVAGCGHRRVSLEVEVKRASCARADGSPATCAHFAGLLRCGSVWECPVCAAHIRAERAAEIRQAVERWGHQQTYMLTLTVRHRWGDELRSMRKGLANAYRRFVRGAPWARICERAGLEHWIRSLEVTHGPNGWHPHLHCLWLVQMTLSGRDKAKLVRKLASRWESCVVAELGESARPSKRRGVKLTKCRDEDYVSKFALELTDPAASKAAARGYCNPWEIAVAASHGDATAGRLWRQYCEGIRGARMLTWSRGLREFAGLDERDDQSVVDAEPEGAELVAVVPSHVWDALRYHRHAACALLEVAELAATAREAAEGIQALALALLSRASAQAA